MNTGLIKSSIAIVILNTYAVAQSTFQRHYGSSGTDRGVAVEETGDGCFLVTGYTTGSGEDVLLMKTDSFGKPIWTKSFGGKGKDDGWAFQQTPDGGAIITGFTDSFGAGGMDVYVIRTDARGDTIWTKTIGGAGEEFSWDIQKTMDDGFIIAAQTTSHGMGEVDAYLIKINSDGKQEWAKAYGGPKTDRIFSVRQTPDGGYVAVGITYSFGAGDRDAYLIKTDVSGELEWFKTFGGAGYDVGHFVTLTDDGGFLVAGYGDSFATHGKMDCYLIKTDGDGEVQWLKTHGRTEDDRAMKAERTKDGGYIAVGFTQISGFDWDVYLVKTDRVGDTTWTRTFGDTENHDSGYTVQETKTGGYVITGQSQNLTNGNTTLLLIKTDSQGHVEH